MTENYDENTENTENFVLPIIVTIFSVSGEIIAKSPVNVDMMKKLNAYNQVSSRNPHKITFIPLNGIKIILEYLEDLIYSPCGTEFTAYYTPIDQKTYTRNYQTYCDDPNCNFECSCDFGRAKNKYINFHLGSIHAAQHRIIIWFCENGYTLKKNSDPNNPHNWYNSNRVESSRAKLYNSNRVEKLYKPETPIKINLKYTILQKCVTNFVYLLQKIFSIKCCWRKNL
jgi:hypothetical protein